MLAIDKEIINRVSAIKKFKKSLTKTQNNMTKKNITQQSKQLQQDGKQILAGRMQNALIVQKM